MEKIVRINIKKDMKICPKCNRLYTKGNFCNYCVGEELFKIEFVKGE